MRRMPYASALLAVSLSLAGVTTSWANTYASVEPIPSTAVADAGDLHAEPLAVRRDFASALVGCGLVTEVVGVLSSSGAIGTIDDLNTSVAIGAGGFAGETNPTLVFTFIDNGPNAASHADISTLIDALGYAMSQGSAFLLDSDDPDAFDFPANYLVVNFPVAPSIEESAALFERVGQIDPDLFETETSGYTQFGRAYLALQPDVDDQQFITGYVRATEELDLEYSPIVGGVPSLFRGGAAFPGNDWSTNEDGEEYLSRLPAGSHAALASIRERHLRFARSFGAGIENGPIGEVRSRLRRPRCP